MNRKPRTRSGAFYFLLGDPCVPNNINYPTRGGLFEVKGM